MLFLNIGLKDTKKFITQAIGRGMRIETVKNNRKRLENIDKEIFYANEDAARTLQTLFIIATANEMIKDILEVAKEVSVSNFTDIKLDKNSELLKDKRLFVLVYGLSKKRCKFSKKMVSVLR